MIVTHNRYELTESCLRHLRAQTIEHRVIVVDNGSTDGTPARLRAEWPDVQVEPLGRNHGFAIGCNRGVARECGGDSWCCSTTTWSVGRTSSSS